MSSNHLPPVRHLPQWSRVGCLGRSCSPRRFLGNQQQVLPASPPADKRAARVAAAAACHGDTNPRIASLQRNIQFLQQQHKGTLDKLHAEVEYLRRENKELHYKLVMGSAMSRGKGSANSKLDIPAQGSELLEEPSQDTQDQALRPNRGTELKGGLITSLQPLRIHSCPSHPPRAPTLKECEIIVRQLYNANSLQSQEIVRMKTLLRDIVLSKKVTQEHYILIKAYLVDGTSKSAEGNKLPKLSLQTVPEKTVGAGQPGVILPALKKSLSSNIVERQRRDRAVQRDRFKTTVR